MVIELKDGTEAECREFWACENELHAGSESGSYIEVTDCETNGLLCVMSGNLPDEEDAEAVTAFIGKVEELVFNF